MNMIIEKDDPRIGECKQYFIEVRDNISLSTYVQFPNGWGPWPVIFSRSPYPEMLSFWLEQARFWAAQGYAFIIQECRGTGESEGVWEPFVHEKKDGLDSLKWIINQTWMDGNVATYGASYSGVVQWCMSESFPLEVKTMFISVTGIERYRQNYMNGMFRHDIYTVWALGNSGVEPLRSEKEIYKEALKVRPHIEMDRHLFGTKLLWYRDWITEVSPDSPYWNNGLWSELKEIPRKVDIPIMMVAGWFDHNLDATIQSYKKLPEKTRNESVLIIGPWIHSHGVSGDLKYKDHDLFGPQQIKAALAWFDHHLKRKKYKQRKGSVHTYIIREEKWETWNNWIQHHEIQSFFLVNDQRLSIEKSRTDKELSFIYNPENPVPTKGGAALMAHLTGESNASPPASVIQDKPGTREDIITFLSDTFAEDIKIVGNIKASLFVSTDAEDTAFTVTVMETFPNSESYNIREGITSLRYRNNASVAQEYRPNSVVEVNIELWPITWTIRKGSRLRIDISSSDFPAYHVHPNTRTAWALQKEMKIAKQTIYYGDLYPSRINVPIKC